MSSKPRVPHEPRLQPLYFSLGLRNIAPSSSSSSSSRNCRKEGGVPEHIHRENVHYLPNERNVRRLRNPRWNSQKLRVPPRDIEQRSVKFIRSIVHVHRILRVSMERRRENTDSETDTFYLDTRFNPLHSRANRQLETIYFLAKLK